MSARRLHRSLAPIAGAFAILWALSGALHPLMTYTAPRPAQQAPPVERIAATGALSPVHSGRAGMARLAPTTSGFVLLLRDEGRIRAVDPKTGEPAEAALHERLTTLARHYAALPDAPVVSITPVRRFDAQYPAINRLLPVYRVTFAAKGGLAVYIDPMTDRLATVSDTRRRTLLFVFSNIHRLEFLSFLEPIRVMAVLALAGAFLAAVGAGVLQAIRPGARRGARAVHRAFALTAAPFALLFAGTGLAHLLLVTVAKPPPAPARFDAAMLSAAPQVEGSLLTAAAGPDGAPVWRLARPEGALYFDAAGLAAPMDDAARARRIAAAHGEADVAVIHQFTDEYGFASKRLPVIRVATPEGPVFVDPAEALIAQEVRGVRARLDAFVLLKAHKFGMLDALGRLPRDLAAAVAAFMVAAAALAGLLLLRRAQRR
jgi:hypothetical protein